MDRVPATHVAPGSTLRRSAPALFRPELIDARPPIDCGSAPARRQSPSNRRTEAVRSTTCGEPHWEGSTGGQMPKHAQASLRVRRNRIKPNPNGLPCPPVPLHGLRGSQFRPRVESGPWGTPPVHGVHPARGAQLSNRADFALAQGSSAGNEPDSTRGSKE